MNLSTFQNDFFEIYKNQRNDTSYENVSVTKFLITLENFSDNWINSFTITALIFFPKRFFFQKCKRILKKIKY